jgi:hypothetical protein
VAFFVSFDHMKKTWIIGLIVTAVTVSCSKRDDEFCNCMEAGEKLNQFSNELLQRGANQEDEVKIKGLRAAKDSACVDFYTMGGDAMREKKKECGYE